VAVCANRIVVGHPVGCIERRVPTCLPRTEHPASARVPACGQSAVEPGATTMPGRWSSAVWSGCLRSARLSCPAWGPVEGVWRATSCRQSRRTADRSACRPLRAALAGLG